MTHFSRPLQYWYSIDADPESAAWVLSYQEVCLDWRKYIQVDPAILAGKAVVRGTRIPVDLLLEKLGAGETLEQLLTAHPRLTPEAVRAAMSFASDIIRADLLYALPDGVA